MSVEPYDPEWDDKYFIPAVCNSCNHTESVCQSCYHGRIHDLWEHAFATVDSCHKYHITALVCFVTEPEDDWKVDDETI